MYQSGKLSFYPEVSGSVKNHAQAITKIVETSNILNSLSGELNQAVEVFEL